MISVVGRAAFVCIFPFCRNSTLDEKQTCLGS